MLVRPVVVAVILVAVTLGGCVGAQRIETAEDAPLEPLTRPVVAIIDSGINPYHNVFRDTAEVTFHRAGAETFELNTSGDYADRLAVDADAWSNVQTRELYSFPGTRLAAISFKETAQTPILDELGHGTAVASVIAAEFPAAQIVVVQVAGDFCYAADCLLHESIVLAVEWASQQSWIDVISLSLAPPGNAPTVESVHSDARRVLAATKAAHDAGKMIIAAAGNVPPPTLTSYISGPPWMVAVGGVNETTRGEIVLAAKGVDVVANYTATTADHLSVDGWRMQSGTSFAAPKVAGVVAQALHELRRKSPTEADGCAVVTQARQVRPLLNASAELFSADEYDGIRPPPIDDPIALVETTAPIIDPALQQGWGYLDGRHIGPIVALGTCITESGGKDPAVAQHMGQWQQVRESYWGK